MKGSLVMLFMHFRMNMLLELQSWCKRSNALPSGLGGRRKTEAKPLVGMTAFMILSVT